MLTPLIDARLRLILFLQFAFIPNQGTQTNMSDPNQDTSLVQLAAEIVSAYVSRNSVPTGDLPGLIQSVHNGLGTLSGNTELQPAAEPQKPAVSIKKSITDEALICLEDGQQFKSLKRHLSSAHGMTPQDYRAKWGLGKDYPMVAPAYANQRSTLALSLGLGRKPKAADEAPSTAMPEPETASTPAKATRRGRAKAAV